ncbi:MAG: glycosyltransferase family 4 protein [Anaerolineales bacterium]
MATSLVRLGHQVNIAALHSRFDELEKTHFEREGVSVWYVSQMHVHKQGNLKAYYPAHQLLGVTAKATVALVRAALATQADIIHVGKPHPMNSIAGEIGHLVQGRKFIVDCDDYEAGTGHFEGRWQKLVVASFEKHIPRRAHIVTTNTQFMRDKLIDWGVQPEKIFYLPNGVDRSRFQSIDPSEVETLRTNLSLQEHKVIAYIGSLSLASHPVDLLIHAFARLHARLPQTTLLLVGGGEDYEALRTLVNSLGLDRAVRFCGRVPPDRVALYYRLADVSVDPVRDDVMGQSRSPIKMFESWACGTPFVSANVGDRKLLLGEPPAGLLAQPGDPESLAKTIQNVLEDHALAQHLRSRGLEQAQAYDWEKLAKELEAKYLSALVGQA